MVVERRSSGGVTTWEHRGLTPVAQTVSTSGDGAASGGVPGGGGAGGLSQAEVDVRFEMIVTDLVGAPLRVVDAQGESRWVARPTVWGQRLSGDEAVMPLAFPGQYVDNESGLHYNAFRYYDPTTARFLTQDPLGLVPSPNPVTYPVNPTTEVDPLGLMGCEDEDINRAVEEIDKGVNRPNVRNPKPFENSGKGGTPKLPEFDAQGNPVEYTEHTVNPRPPGGSLDGKRLITGSDGSVWATIDHFLTWIQIR